MSSVEFPKKYKHILSIYKTWWMSSVEFPKKYEHILSIYKTTKEIGKTKSFLLDLNNIPELIYGKSKDYWFFAEGKNGLYNFEDSIWQKETLSLNEIYKKIPFNRFDFIIGNKGGVEKYLAKHPISGKMTEWTPEEAYDMVVKLDKPIPELEHAISKDSDCACDYARFFLKKRFPLGEPAIAKDADASYNYARNVIKGRFELGEPAIAKDYEKSELYARRFDFDLSNGKFVSS